MSKELFKELKDEVREKGLLDRVPVRGSIEMIAIIISICLSLYTAAMWNPILLGLFITLVMTRSVFVSHDVLHTQYFKNKSFSKILSYPFSTIILNMSPSWWDWKHNVNHHTYCNIEGKDDDIKALNKAFTKNKGDNKFLKKNKYLIFWGAQFFMYPAFVAQSYKFVITRKLWGEMILMLLHFTIIWGTLIYQIGSLNTLIVAVTVVFSLSPWLSFGFITNHLGCETFEPEEGAKLSWMELQMRGSRSLSGGSFIHWFYGGLNTQIEHHLFPKAPRFNLLKIQKLTKDFSKKHNIKYFETTPLGAYVQINDALKDYK